MIILGLALVQTSYFGTLENPDPIPRFLMALALFMGIIFLVYV